VYVRLSVFLAILFIAIPAQSAFTCKGTTGGKVGQCAKDFTLPDLNGTQVSLSAHSGKVIFLNFWATWCAPCADEIPSMESLMRKMASNKKFAMLTVSIDVEGASIVQKYFQAQFNHQPNFPVLFDTKKTVSSQYGTFKVPETFIIDKTGKILDKVEGIKDWNDPMLLHYLELLTSIN